MVRRSTPQKIVDDRAFPIRILFYEKDIAVGNYARIMNWLGGNMRLGDYAEHGGPSSADRTIAYYFRTMKTRSASVLPLRISSWRMVPH
ncbi:hypothetical protein ADT71_04025 [Novosphingobium sp. ST904]|nr:hypothetical protein ADT71_04025 [Novosphingobium sp. ST904]